MPRPKKVFAKRPNKFFGKRKRKLSDSDSGSVQTQPRPSISATTESTENKKDSASKRKVGPQLNSYDLFIDENNQCYDIVDFNHLEQLMKQIAVCADCGKQLSFTTTSRIGLSVKLIIKCTGCGIEVAGINDKKMNGQQSELNTRLVYGFRCIGKGEEAAKTVCGVLNLSRPPAFKYYKNRLHKAVKEVCVEGFKHAVEEAVMANNNDRNNLSVSLDGTWQRRGHKSLNGVVTAVSVDTGKVLDVKIFSKHCRCKNKLYRQHEVNCEANYEGVSGGMEVKGVSEIFSESEDKYGVKYKYYLGDGDSAAFPTVDKLMPYGPNFKLEKLECVGHVQKRMGSRLKALKKQMAGSKLEDDKTIGGRGRLTDSAILDIQNYYGLAIRRNTNSLDEMKKAVWSLYFHLYSTNESPLHNLCPGGADSWCKYQRAIANEETYDHKNHFHLPKVVMDKLKQIFRDLASPDLLKKCLHGGTQNPNESVNNIIWSRLPKTTFVQRSTLEVGVYEAVACFNQGNIVRCLVLKQLGYKPGNNLVKILKEKDELRIRQAEKAIEELEKKCRRKSKLTKLRLEELLEKEEDPDNPAYAAGHY